MAANYPIYEKSSFLSSILKLGSRFTNLHLAGQKGAKPLGNIFLNLTIPVYLSTHLFIASAN